MVHIELIYTKILFSKIVSVRLYKLSILFLEAVKISCNRCHFFCHYGLGYHQFDRVLADLTIRANLTIIEL